MAPGSAGRSPETGRWRGRDEDKKPRRHARRDKDQKGHRMRRTTALVVVAALSLFTAACGKSSNSTTSNSSPSTPAVIKAGGTVTISNEQGQTWPCQFNPFNPANNAESLGFVYEPLVYVNLLDNQKETDMLATKYTWN